MTCKLIKYLFFTFISETAFPICISLICPFPLHLTLMGKMVKVTMVHGSWNFYKQALKTEIRFLAVRPKRKELNKHTYQCRWWKVTRHENAEDNF